MNRKLMMLVILLLVGISIYMIFSLGLKPILISESEAINIATKASGCNNTQNTEVNLFHVKNGILYKVPKIQGYGVVEIPYGSDPNVFGFGYQWQVTVTCFNDQHTQLVDYIEWIDAFTGQLIH